VVRREAMRGIGADNLLTGRKPLDLISGVP
jgi:hypothetical protein